MRRFLITAKSFTGSAELIYNDEGLIGSIDMADTNMTPEQRHIFKAAVPLTTKHIEHEGHALVKCTIVEAEFEVSMEDFIREYPYKRNTHLIAAEWQKLTKSEQVQSVLEAKEYRKYCDKNSHWYKPMIAATWLKRKEFLNEWKKL